MDGRYLGLKIDQIKNKISLFQELFIDELLREFGIKNYHLILISLDPGFKSNTDPDDDFNINPRYNHEFTKHSY